MKIISFNVNNLAAAMNKNLIEYLRKQDADIVCLQETKLIYSSCLSFINNFKKIGYPWCYFNCCETRKGYSGTALLTKTLPNTCDYSLPGSGRKGNGEFDTEGRIIIAEYPNFYIINTNVPNSGANLESLEYRTTRWDEIFFEKLQTLDKQKPVIWTGDLNVAHQEIDTAVPEKRKNKIAGFCDLERENFKRVLSHNFTDVWRYQNPDKQAFSFWSHKYNLKEKNLGWRLDYWIVSDRIKDLCIHCDIHADIQLSDHVPILLEISPETT